MRACVNDTDRILSNWRHCRARSKSCSALLRTMTERFELHLDKAAKGSAAEITDDGR
jgi:hypothetical protein